MKKWPLHCCYGQFLVFSLKNSSPPLIRIQNCHQKQDLGCKNPNFVKRVIWRIFDLLFWKNTCFSLFFFNFGVNLLKYAPTHTNDCSSLKKINKKRKQNIPKLSSAQSTVGGLQNAAILCRRRLPAQAAASPCSTKLPWSSTLSQVVRTPLPFPSTSLHIFKLLTS